MKKFNTLWLLLTLLTSACCSQNVRHLKVDLYPAIPNHKAFYDELKRDFEKMNPGLVLDTNILDASTYYDRSGLLSDKADVYEIDCVLLSNFISSKKIQPLTNYAADLLDKNNLMPAGQITYQNGDLYAIPHWLCSDFLFSRSNDRALNSISSFSALQGVIGNQPAPAKSISVDLVGKLTLGETYAGIVYDEYGNLPDLIAHSDTNHIDNVAFQDLKKLLNLTNPVWSRSSAWHNSDKNLFAYQFAKKGARSYIGYSESLYDMFLYVRDSCSTCATTGDIHIQNLVLDDRGKYGNDANHVGWVDALAIDSGAKGQKLTDAKNFIKFLVSKEAYYKALIPANGDPARYLLPAYKEYYSDGKVLKYAPLYSTLFPMALTIQPVAGQDLGYNLRAVGAKLGKMLPAQ